MNKVRFLSIIVFTGCLVFGYARSKDTKVGVRPGMKTHVVDRDGKGNIINEWDECLCGDDYGTCYCYTVVSRDASGNVTNTYYTWSDDKPSTIFHPDNGEEGSIGNTEIVFDGDRKVIIVEFLPSKGRIDSKTKLEPEWLIRDFDPGTAFLKRHDIKVIEDQFVKPRIVDGKVIFEMRTGKLEDSIMDAKKVETQEIERKEPEPREIKEIEPIKK